MNKLTYLIAFLCVFTWACTAQSIRINAIVQGNCPSGSQAPDVIELYVDGTVNVSNLRIQYQFDFSTFWNLNVSIGTGEFTDTYIYLVNDIEAFDREFPGLRTTDNTTVGDLLFTIDGGEKIRLVDSSNNDEVLDIYGLDGVEDDAWNFNNSFVKRSPDAIASATFNISEWSIQPQNTLSEHGLCWQEFPLNEMVNLQDSSLSIEKVSAKNQLTIYPNPTKGDIQISNSFEVESYAIYNVLGHKITSGSTRLSNMIDLSAQANGIYFVNFDNGQTIKIIKS